MLIIIIWTILEVIYSSSPSSFPPTKEIVRDFRRVIMSWPLQLLLHSTAQHERMLPTSPTNSIFPSNSARSTCAIIVIIINNDMPRQDNNRAQHQKSDHHRHQIWLPVRFYTGDLMICHENAINEKVLRIGLNPIDQPQNQNSQKVIVVSWFRGQMKDWKF